MIMSSVAIRDARKQIVTSGLILHLDNSVASYPRTGTNWSDISGNNRNFYSRHQFNGAGKSPVFTKNPMGYYGFEMNGHIAEASYIPTFYHVGAYYFQETTTPINFDSSWTLEFLVCPNGAGRPEDGCGSKVSGLFIKMGSGANTSTQYFYGGHRVNFQPINPGTFNQSLDSNFIGCGPIIEGICSNTLNYRAAVATSYFGINVPFYISFCFNKQSSTVFNFLYYINGNLYHTSANQSYSNAPDGPFLIGGGDNNCGSSNGWRGWIHDVRMYNRVLTAAEIKQNFNAIRGKAGL